MSVILQVDGREMSFTKQELVDIVKEHLSNKTTKEATATKVAQKPTEDEWFKVKPQTIDQTLFEEEREDTNQEKTRKLILEAFAEMKANPERYRYGQNFETMMPKKKWDVETAEHLRKIANNLGHHMANWVEQALEWAQRISNGESWETICNDPDTAKWYRLVRWRRDFMTIGGAVYDYNSAPASCIGWKHPDYHHLYGVVPLVVRYEK